MRYRSRGSIGEPTARVVVRDMLQARLILTTGIWWGRRMLLDKRFAPHSGAAAGNKSRPRLITTVVTTTQCAVSSTSGMRTSTWSQNVWRYQHQQVATRMLGRGQVATTGCEQRANARTATPSYREMRWLLARVESRNLPNENVLVQIWN